MWVPGIGCPLVAVSSMLTDCGGNYGARKWMFNAFTPAPQSWLPPSLHRPSCIPCRHGRVHISTCIPRPSTSWPPSRVHTYMWRWQQQHQKSTLLTYRYSLINQEDCLSPKGTFGKSKAVWRSLQPKWFDTWKWIHYDETRDAAFCHTFSRWSWSW